MELNKVYNEDCLIGMQRIPDKSIDMILCDLPYGTTQNKWDIVISFDALWAQYHRISKPNAAIVLFSAQPFTSLLVSSNLKDYKYEWVWVKNLKTGNLNARKMPMGGHETIQVFYKKQPTYNPQKRQRTTEVMAGNKFNSKTTNYGKQKADYLDRQSELINPDTALLNFKCVHSSEGKLHSTQKPVPLCEYLIKTYSNESDIVLDNCMGSGTTAIACINTNRNFIGFENDKRHFNSIQERISKHKMMTKATLMNGASQPEMQKEQILATKKQQALLF